MTGLNMEGPYNLSLEEVDRAVKKTVGNYALGFVDSMDGRFVVLYIGRSDQDLNAELKTFIDRGGYKKFKFSYQATPQEAFMKECYDYHDFSPIHNTSHPQRPEGSNVRCPRCGIFDSKP